MKKQTGDTTNIHKEGYRFDPIGWTPTLVQEGYVGWDLAAGSQNLVVASGVRKPDETPVGIIGKTSSPGQPVDVSVNHETPVLIVGVSAWEALPFCTLDRRLGLFVDGSIQIDR